jgi:hypothetical protein
MANALFTGLLYFLAVFTFAFAMGVTRELVVAPRVGSTVAVLMEIPLIIVASWIVAHRLLRNRAFTVAQRATMGATAFALTLASEAVLSGIIRGQSIADWVAGLATPLGLAGLAGQLAFAALPIFVGHGGADTPSTV